MKFTEGAFRDWGYQLAKEEYADVVVTEDELGSKHDGRLPAGKVLLNGEEVNLWNPANRPRARSRRIQLTRRTSARAECGERPELPRADRVLAVPLVADAHPVGRRRREVRLASW